MCNQNFAKAFLNSKVVRFSYVEKQLYSKSEVNLKLIVKGLSEAMGVCVLAHTGQFPWFFKNKKF